MRTTLNILFVRIKYWESVIIASKKSFICQKRQVNQKYKRKSIKVVHSNIFFSSIILSLFIFCSKAKCPFSRSSNSFIFEILKSLFDKLCEFLLVSILKGLFHFLSTSIDTKLSSLLEKLWSLRMPQIQIIIFAIVPATSIFLWLVSISHLFYFLYNSIQDSLIEKCRGTLTSFYGSNPADSDSFGRIVNSRHTRL